MLVPTFCRYLRYPQVFCLLGLDFFSPFLSFFIFFISLSFFIFFLSLSFFPIFLLRKSQVTFWKFLFLIFHLFFCIGRVNDDATCSCFNCHFSWYFSSLIMPEQPDVIQSCTKAVHRLIRNSMSFLFILRIYNKMSAIPVPRLSCISNFFSCKSSILIDCLFNLAFNNFYYH